MNKVGVQKALGWDKCVGAKFELVLVSLNGDLLATCYSGFGLHIRWCYDGRAEI